MFLKKPLIGINPYYFHYRDSFWNATREKYYRAIWKAGGVPLTLHHPSDSGSIKELADSINGLIMVGGPDIPCNVYESKNPGLLDEDVMLPERELFDRNMFLIMKRLHKPILSICAGIQHINVIYGGNLYEDLKTLTKTSVDHGEFNGDVSYHDVVLERNSHIYSVIGKQNIKVASSHHQGIQKLGSGLAVSGVAPDGLIEAMEDTNHPDSFIAVQWHPEIMTENKNQLKLFQWVCSEAVNGHS